MCIRDRAEGSLGPLRQAAHAVAALDQALAEGIARARLQCCEAIASIGDAGAFAGHGIASGGGQRTPETVELRSQANECKARRTRLQPTRESLQLLLMRCLLYTSTRGAKSPSC